MSTAAFTAERIRRGKRTFVVITGPNGQTRRRPALQSGPSQSDSPTKRSVLPWTLTRPPLERNGWVEVVRGSSLGCGTWVGLAPALVAEARELAVVVS